MTMFLGWGFRPINKLEENFVYNKLQTSNKSNHQNSSQHLTRTVLRHRDVEWTAGDVFLSPLHG